MARARNLKPGFFKNDELAETGPLGMLLFEGLWTIADRAGRLEDRPLRIKAEVLPYFDADVDGLLSDLAERGFVRRYEAGGKRIVQVENFGKHQTPHPKEPASQLPDYDSPPASRIPDYDSPPEGSDKGSDKTPSKNASSLNPSSLLSESLLSESGMLNADTGGVQRGADGPAADAAHPDPPQESETVSPENADDEPPPVPPPPPNPRKGAPAPKSDDGRVYALVDAFAVATKRRPNQIQGRDRKIVADAFRPLVGDAEPEDVVGVVAYLRTDPFWRKPGALTAAKAAEVLPQWVSDGRPMAVEATAKPNGRASPADDPMAYFTAVAKGEL